MTTAAVAASVAFSLGVWITVAVMTLAARNRPTCLLASAGTDLTESQARALRAEVHADLQLPPSEDDHTEDLRPEKARPRTVDKTSPGSQGAHQPI
ncbi:hypothetical protein GCM10009624_10600 [Gordonia sinesedis]